jgi:integrase
MRDPLLEAPAFKSLDDLDNWLASCSAIVMPSNRCYERRSAIKRTAVWFGVPPDQIPLELDDLRKRFARLSPGALKVKRKTISNTKSAVLSAIRAAGILPKRSYVDTFLSEWQAIWALLTDAEKRQISRFFRFASSRCVTVEMVDDVFSRAFLDHLANATLTKQPKVAHQNACRVWNRLCARLPEHLPGFVGKPLEVPGYMQQLCLPKERFPVPLWQEFEAFLKLQGQRNYFDKRYPDKPLRQTTIGAYRRRFHMYVSGLVLAGYDPAIIADLAFCVRKPQVDAGLKAVLDWRQLPGKEAQATAAGIAIFLLTLANRGVKKVTKADLAHLKMVAGKLRARPKGLAPRTRRKVTALKHEANLARLFIMPLAIAKRLAALGDDEITAKDALLFQKVLAMIILMFCPLRIGTLSGLHLDANLAWANQREMSGGLKLNIDESQMKGDHAAVMPMPEMCAKLIRTYITRFRGRLAPPASRFLFTGEAVERGKDTNTLSRQIKRLIFDALGFDVTPHVYRHLVHVVVLNRFPGAYAMVARVLTHRNINTTIQNYSYMDIELSMQAYQSLVLDRVDPSGKPAKLAPAEIAYSLNKEAL